MSIKVEDKGLYHRAEQMISVTPGGPYRSMAMSSYRIVAAWGRTPESAAERCRHKARKIANADKKWAEDKQRRTQVFPS